MISPSSSATAARKAAIVSDSDGKILYANEAYMRLSGAAMQAS